jgi:hypothetical protein
VIKNASAWIARYASSERTSEEVMILSKEPAIRIEADLEAPQLFGKTPYGERRVINIIGGTVSGPRLTGKILPGGADWQIIRTDGVADIFAKYTFQIDGGGFVLVTSAGLRHGPPDVIAKLAKGEPVARDQYYFRTSVRFETADPQADWLNRVLMIAVGAREKMKVKLDLFEVL